MTEGIKVTPSNPHASRQGADQGIPLSSRPGIDVSANRNARPDPFRAGLEGRTF
jgi:hypothetical protein